MSIAGHHCSRVDGGVIAVPELEKVLPITQIANVDSVYSPVLQTRM
jgi:hypothetical protein